VYNVNRLKANVKKSFIDCYISPDYKYPVLQYFLLRSLYFKLPICSFTLAKMRLLLVLSLAILVAYVSGANDTATSDDYYSDYYDYGSDNSTATTEASPVEDASETVDYSDDYDTAATSSEGSDDSSDDSSATDDSTSSQANKSKKNAARQNRRRRRTTVAPKRRANAAKKAAATPAKRRTPVAAKRNPPAAAKRNSPVAAKKNTNRASNKRRRG